MVLNPQSLLLLNLKIKNKIISVCDTHENLALNKETSSLSMYTSTNPSSKAVDGDWNTDGIQGSGCFFSLRGPQWMAVDLGATYDVCQVRVLNRNEMSKLV